MTVQGDTAGMGDKELKKTWPITEGLVAGTTKTHDKEINLVSEEISNVPSRYKELMGN